MPHVSDIKLIKTNIQGIVSDVMITMDSMNALQLLPEARDFSDHDLLARNIRKEASKLGDRDFHHV
ncbi:hypothetical protein Syun_022794 [Stephania yunnanensis]|uniref:Uncharacterized protein n=1 Tax=Stephania yunnanensis TaxID=152371 RepID=A0AAP0HYW7_9MAGN